MPYKSEPRPLTSIVSYPERGEGGNLSLIHILEIMRVTRNLGF